jgi:hypothetical protein
MSDPMIAIELLDVTRAGTEWRLRWQVTNAAGDQIRLVSMQAPHGKFRAEPMDLNKVLVESAVVEQVVRVDAAAGDDIENAFVIFLVGSGDQTWRVLFRLRVHVGDDGTPAPVIEAITSHPVGFSEA